MAPLPIMSVSGIRGLYPEVLTEEFVSAIAYIQTMHAGGAKRMIVGRDTRPSGPAIEKAICRGIRAAGGTPVSIGIAPTPTTCFAVAHGAADGGVIITASHNPLPYNGYKMVHRHGRLFSGAECDAVYEAFEQGDYPSAPEFLRYDGSPAEKVDAVTPHIDAICDAVDTAAIAAADLHVAVDAINGAAGVIFPALLTRLNVSWEGVHTKLDGDFVHNPEPRPEHLGDLAALLGSKDGFCGGFVYDPDADRLALMGEKGEAVSEEMTLVLALENVLERTPGNIATNLSTSMVIDDVADAYGVSVYRTKIGEANVVEAIQREECRIGGEGNGGVIFPEISTVRDGLGATALILELLAKRATTVMGLTGKWTEYPLVKEKVAVSSRSEAEELLGAAERYFAQKGAKIDTQDGVKITYPDGWVHVRASNTEPILRCYAEGKDYTRAEQYAQEVLHFLKK
ncbi:phosphoglucosamine mutase [Chitinivibrio alkaliphilus]|uniref:N-acetylglucosamine-1-P-mutase n=1 Tax=Chitinivibrio alkaliphilus ACht1 TaxID=1313304 RepID=U7D9N1_9BACT|nr:phosphoglucosamine mutase [Chitinivibrio alkaliphilus]ERP38732.1 N-acetylglucosamine-1-P-mutase [Chitinivibrio alkaliphilus ACht1]